LVSRLDRIAALERRARHDYGVRVTTEEITTGELGMRRELRAMLPVSKAILRGGSLGRILDLIAAQAADVVPGAGRTSIILIEGSDHRFRLGGSHGLSERYRLLLSTGEAKLRPGEGPSGVAYARRRPVLISDVDDDPIIRSWSWREIVPEEGYKAIVSVPLIPDDRVVGTLNLYRSTAGPWPAEQIRVLTFFAEHAAAAVRTAQLLDQRSKQVSALRRLVRSLREQAHEHGNRLHAVSGLLALGEVDEAAQLIADLSDAHLEVRNILDASIHVPVVAGLIFADATVAAQRGISLEIARDSSLRALPPTLSDTQIVTILGNLLDNAFDAVTHVPPERRVVRLRIDDSGGRTVIEVADHGPGMPTTELVAFQRGVTSKPGHDGVGLWLVQEAVTAAMGTVEARASTEGTTIRVAFPHG
jgi:GAF domain-containing protein